MPGEPALLEMGLAAGAVVTTVDGSVAVVTSIISSRGREKLLGGALRVVAGLAIGIVLIFAF